MRILLLLLPLFLSPAAWAGRTILIYGDSLSAGYGLPIEKAWPSLLQQKLAKQRPDYTVVNLSISGETTAGGRSRLKAALEQHRPAIFVLLLGANDGLRGLPMAQMRDNLQAMLRMAQAQGARNLLVGMRLPPNYGPYADDFAQSFADIARSTQTPFEPFLLAPIATQPAQFQADGLHPTAPAQVQLLEHVWPKLAPLLK